MAIDPANLGAPIAGPAYQMIMSSLALNDAMNASNVNTLAARQTMRDIRGQGQQQAAPQPQQGAVAGPGQISPSMQLGPRTPLSMQGQQQAAGPRSNGAMPANPTTNTSSPWVNFQPGGQAVSSSSGLPSLPMPSLPNMPVGGTGAGGMMNGPMQIPVAPVYSNDQMSMIMNDIRGRAAEGGANQVRGLQQSLGSRGFGGDSALGYQLANEIMGDSRASGEQSAVDFLKEAAAANAEQLARTSALNASNQNQWMQNQIDLRNSLFQGISSLGSLFGNLM